MILLCKKNQDPAGGVERTNAIHSKTASKAVSFFLFSILLGSLDFKATESGAGFLIQIPLMGIFFISTALLMTKFWTTGLNYKRLSSFISLCFLFLVPSTVIGVLHDQDVWALLTNFLAFCLFVGATLGTYAMLSLSPDMNKSLSQLKSLCLFYMIFHFIIIYIIRGGIDLSTSRQEVLSEASIAASAILAISCTKKVSLIDILISCVNILIIFISVTRTQFLVIFCQLASIFFLKPSLVFNRLVVKRMSIIMLMLVSVLLVPSDASDLLFSRWTSRMSSYETRGADPTALTRLAESRYMLENFLGSIDGFFFGNGLAADTKLIGPEAEEAASIVGPNSVYATHGKGYGHNNHLSLLFIGGIFFGLPLLVLIAGNTIKALGVVKKTYANPDIDPTITYIALLGALIVIGAFVMGSVSFMFPSRPRSMWYGIGMGILYWFLQKLKNTETLHSKPIFNRWIKGGADES